MKTCIIACINSKNALGKDNELMYKISNDLKNFKRLTNHSIVIMGRKTWDSLPKKPLPNRVNVVVTSQGEKFNKTQEEFQNLVEKSEECVKVKDLESALNFAEVIAGRDTSSEVFIIGGGTLYNEAIEKNYVAKLYLTEVEDNTEGDTYFPDVSDEKKWITRFQTEYFTDPNSQYKYRYTIKDLR